MSFSLLSGRPSPRGRHRGLPRPWLAASVLLLCGLGASTPSGPTLKEGLFLERELRAKEQHRYPVSLEEGEFLRVVVDQNGIDVTVELLGPDGKVVSAIDSANGANGDEDFAALARQAGLHQVRVRALEDGAPPASYTLQVEGPRNPRKRDRARVEAVQAMQAAFTPPSSVEKSERALGLWRDLGDERRQAEILLYLSQQQSDQGDLERAREHAIEAAGLWKELGKHGEGYPRGQVDALLKAGLASRKLGRWKEAQAQLEEAAAVARTTGFQDQEMNALNSLGVLHTERGEPQKALEPLQAAFELARRREDRKSQSIVLSYLGDAYQRMADRQQALRSYEEALLLSRALGDPRQEGIALNNLCDIYRSLGDWEKARSLCLQALDLIRKLGDPATEGRILNNLGAVAKRQLRLEEALDLYGQSLELARRSGDTEVQRTALNNLGFLYLRLNQLDKAFAHCQEALALAGRSRETEIDSRHILGAVHRKWGDLRAAREELEKALAASRSWGDREREADVSLPLARVQRDSGDLNGALARVESAIDVVESLRTRVQDQSLRALFFAANQDYYEFAIDTAMVLHASDPSAGHLAKALQMSERARARSLLEILSESGTDIRQGVDPALLERERGLRSELSRREMQRLELLTSENPERLEEAERQIEEILEKYRKAQEDLRAGSPRYTALTQPRPLGLREIQTQVLDGQAVLLEYSLGAERSHVWAVTPDSIQGFELPGKVRIEEAASTYYRMLTARNQHLPGEKTPDLSRRVKEADAQVQKAAVELSQLVLAPVEPLLGKGTVLVVADGALQYVPFGALPLPSARIPLIDRQEVVSLPSASALAVLRQEIRGRGRAPKTLAVLADPVFREDDSRLRRLTVPAPRNPTAASFKPHRGLSLSLAQGRQAEASPMKLPRLFSSETEAKAIAALVPADQRFEALGFAASRETATSGKLGQYRMVHFATHGLLRSDHPELSSLVLSLYDEQGNPRDGLLRLSDIYNLELKADLVVLSACQTALGKEIRGEGLVGLTRGFMYAGAERVLASLWSVEDRATAELMKRFYHALLVEDLRPAAALRKAQLDMAESSRWSSPYYWAGFSLQGEWK